jgi:hypothetical protein
LASQGANRVPCEHGRDGCTTFFHERARVTDIRGSEEIGLLAALDALAHSAGRAEFGPDLYLVTSPKIFRDCAERLAQASRCQHRQLVVFGANQIAAKITMQTEMPINRRTAVTRAQCSILSATASLISRRSFAVSAKDTWKPSDVRRVTMRISGHVLYSISQPATG